MTILHLIQVKILIHFTVMNIKLFAFDDCKKVTFNCCSCLIPSKHVGMNKNFFIYYMVITKEASLT